MTLQDGWFDGWERRPTDNMTPGGEQTCMGLVLHIMDGTLDGTDSWFHDPSSRASSHVGHGRDGRRFQWVKVGDRAWAEAGGNPYWVSSENEGNSGEALTNEQIESNAQVLAALHVTHGVPIAITDDVNVPGLGWHGMGGNLWGGHFNCPGDPVLAQRGAIIARANELVYSSPASNPAAPSNPPLPQESDMNWVIIPGKIAVRRSDGAVYTHGDQQYHGAMNDHAGNYTLVGEIVTATMRDDGGYTIWSVTEDGAMHWYDFPSDNSQRGSR